MREPAIAPQAVRDQLRRILGSEPFLRARRMQRFLEFVVEETLAGRADQLGEYGIGTAVFDRGPDFDPAVEPIVRNDARRLRAKLLEYYSQPQAWAADAVRIEIPKGGYVPVFSAVRAMPSYPAPAAATFAVMSTASFGMRLPFTGGPSHTGAVIGSVNQHA